MAAVHEYRTISFGIDVRIVELRRAENVFAYCLVTRTVLGPGTTRPNVAIGLSPRLFELHDVHPNDRLNNVVHESPAYGRHAVYGSVAAFVASTPSAGQPMS